MCWKCHLSWSYTQVIVQSWEIKSPLSILNTGNVPDIGVGGIGKYLIMVYKIKYCDITKYRLNGFTEFKAEANYSICPNICQDMLAFKSK